MSSTRPKLEPYRPPLLPISPTVKKLEPYRPPPIPMIRQSSKTTTTTPSTDTLKHPKPNPGPTTNSTSINNTSKATTATSTSTSPTKSISKPYQKPKLVPKTPLEILYMRRASVREQKRQSILQNIQYFPSKIVYGQMALLGLIALVMIAVQIAIIVEQTSLFYVCSGFWCGAILILCIAYLFLFGSYRSSLFRLL
jgi:hypothetical protein